jgi:Protein of unknown function (DUF4199)
MSEPPPNNPLQTAPAIGYRTHWWVVLKYGLLITLFQTGSFYLFYLTGLAESSPQVAGLYTKLLAWIPTIALYWLAVKEVRQLDGTLTTYRGLYYVLLLAFFWLTLDTLNGILFEYHIDPGYDLRVLENSRTIGQKMLREGTANPEILKKNLAQLEDRIARARLSSPTVLDLFISNFSLNLMASSIWGLIIGVLTRPYNRR